MLNHPAVKLIGEVVDRVPIELHERLLVEALKSELVQIGRPPQLFILELVADLIITEHGVFRNSSILIKDP